MKKKYNILKYSNIPILLLNSPEKCFAVYNSSEKFLSKNKSIAEEIDLYVEIHRDLFYLIPETKENFWSGHIFPYVESEYELEASVILATFGFYKQAINCLRNVLELGLLSVYFNIEDKGHKVIQNWLHSLENTPYKRKVLDKLLTEKNISIFNCAINIEDKINDLYAKLCNFTHTKGIKHSSEELLNSNVNNFNKNSFLKWLGFLKEVIHLVVVLHLLKYPIGLQYIPLAEKFGINAPIGFLHPYQVDRIKQILDNKTLDILQKISDEDEKVIALVKSIKALPDITAEEKAKEIEKFDKFLIEKAGFKVWFSSEKKILKHLQKKSPKEYEEKLKYIEKMKKWAKEQQFNK